MLKPGGRLLLFREALRGNVIMELYRALWPARWKRYAQKFSNHLTVKEIEQAAVQYFASVEHREFYFVFSILRRSLPWLMNRVIRNRIQYRLPACKWSRAIDRTLLRRFPILRHSAWITAVCFWTHRDPSPIYGSRILMGEGEHKE